MEVLPSHRIRPEYWEPIESQLLDIFYKIIFEPVVGILQTHNPNAKGLKGELRNAPENDMSTLLSALRRGKIQYDDGKFSGEFSASTGRALRSIGAKFSKTSKCYLIDDADLDPEVKKASNTYILEAKKIHDIVKGTLDERLKKLEMFVQTYTVNPKSSVNKVTKGVDKQIKVISRNPTSEFEKHEMSENYTDNMKKWIKNFSKEEIQKLRAEVEQNAEAGYRFDKLVDKIKERYDVSRSKAQFLARQETSLFMAEVRKDRFKEAGVRRYIWRTAKDSRVRHSHKELDGKVFSYDHPPVVEADGSRANPGEDFGCRCVDEPILETAYA